MKKITVKEEVRLPDSNIILEKGDKVLVKEAIGDWADVPVDDNGEDLAPEKGKEILQKLIKFGKCYAFHVISKVANIYTNYKGAECRIKKLGSSIKLFNLSKGISCNLSPISQFREVTFNQGIVKIVTRDLTVVEIATDEDVAVNF
jgi:hypothetical protein